MSHLASVLLLYERMSGLRSQECPLMCWVAEASLELLMLLLLPLKNARIIAVCRVYTCVSLLIAGIIDM